MSQQIEPSVRRDPQPDPRAILQGLNLVRARTLELIAPISDESLAAQHSRLMSPIAWDLGHIAAFEQLWLVDRLGQVTTESDLEETYDAFRTPRAERGDLELMDRRSIRERMADVRVRVREKLQDPGLDSDNPLLADGFAWELVRQHEAQHQETVLQTIQLMRDGDYHPPIPFEPVAPSLGRGLRALPPAGTMIRVPAGPFTMGAAGPGFAYDNERPAWTVEVPAFELGAHPVTNGEYAEFISGDGYLDRSLWSDEGWSWLQEAGPSAPHYWLPRDEAGEASPPDPAAPVTQGEERSNGPTPEDAAEISRSEGLDGWRSRTALGVRPLRSNEPVVHVCFHEAEAYARFAGARLPSEMEWEKAAAWDPDTGCSRPYPWGHEPPTRLLANIDQLSFGVTPIGSYPAGASPVGCFGLHGDVWEWTTSTFEGYPGFRAFPYREYSEVFFGAEYRVLRGSSWATAPCVVRNTFRNWDYPIRRQVFSGMRLARDLT